MQKIFGVYIGCAGVDTVGLSFQGAIVADGRQKLPVFHAMEARTWVQ
jgi:hypothetical protein